MSWWRCDERAVRRVRQARRSQRARTWHPAGEDAPGPGGSRGAGAAIGPHGKRAAYGAALTSLELIPPATEARTSPARVFHCRKYKMYGRLIDMYGC